MVNTDFILSYLTGTVDDEILDKLVPDKEIDFTISSPDAYWSKQQIKDSYKTPTGSFNKDAFLNDYETLSKKYEEFQFKRFGETLLAQDNSVIEFEKGGKIPMYQEGKTIEPSTSKSKSMSKSEYEGSMESIMPDYRSPSIEGYESRKIWNGRAVNTQAGVQFVPDRYTTFTHEGGFADLAKGRSINELAEENDGVLDSDGNLVTENIWNKIFDSKYVTVDQSGKFQEKQFKSGENAALALAKGVTKERDIVLDKITSGESVFGARQQDDYYWKNRKWYEKIPLGVKLGGEGLLKGSWNLAMGIPYGATSLARTFASDNEGAPEWLNNVNTFLESQQLRSDVATDEAKWYTPQGFTSGIVSGVGQLGAIATYTAVAIKLGKKLREKDILNISEATFAKGLNLTTAVGFGLWGASEVDTQLQAQGNTNANQRKAIHAATVLALTGVNSFTNIFLSKLDPNTRKKIIVDATRTGMKDAVNLANSAGKDIASVASKAIFENVNKTVSKMMSTGYKALKTQTAIDFTKEATQEISEEIVPDVTMLIFPRVYNTLIDAMGGKKEDQFTFNGKGEKEYMDFLNGKHLENYFTAGLFGGITGGLASTAHNWGVKQDQDISYIGALTMNGEDWSDKNVDNMYEGILNQINKEYNQGKAGPTTMGLDKVSMKNTIITEENRKDVTSYADLIRTQAINDLNIARESVKNLTVKGGVLDQFKTRWNAVNKSVENIEQFNKFALSFAEKSSVNTYLMNEFKSLVGTKFEANFQKQQDKLSQIDLRNKLLAENKPEEAQLIQDKLMGITKSSKKESSISVTTDLEKSNEAIELVRKQTEDTIADTQQKLENLTNGVSFIRGMQQAFVRGQVNEGFDVVNNKLKYTNTLNWFGRKRVTSKGKEITGSTVQELMDNFNTLNMTSQSYIEFKNQQIENEITRIKELNAPIKEKIDSFNSTNENLPNLEKLVKEYGPVLEQYQKLRDDEETLDSQDPPLKLTDEEKSLQKDLYYKLDELDGEFTKYGTDFETANIQVPQLLLEKRNLESSLVEEPKKIQFNNTPYLNRLDTDKFVSLDSSLEDYVNDAFQKSKIGSGNNPDFIDNNLINILKELQVRLAQVELNYGSNRKMADFEKEAVPILSELLGESKEGVKASYDIGKAKVKAIDYGKNKEGKKQKLDRDGSKSFLAIDNYQSYNEAKSKLISLLEQTRALKVLSDSNRPDIDITRMGDDVKHIITQFEVFQDILGKSVDTEGLITLSKSYLDEDGKPIQGKLNQDVLNALISSLNDLEYKIHLGLVGNDSTIIGSIEKVKTLFSLNPIYKGYTKEQYDSLVRNISKNNIHLFYGWYGLEASSFDKVPSFTQLEVIKHTYWNLTNPTAISSTTKTVFENSAGLWGNQGSGKTSVCAVMVTKLYKRFIASKEIDNISASKEIKDNLRNFSYSGKYFKQGNNNYKIYSRINEDKSGGDHYYISGDKFLPVPTKISILEDDSTMLASSNVDRIWGLADEFEKAKIKFTRINSEDSKKGEGDSSYKDPIGALIEKLLGFKIPVSEESNLSNFISKTGNKNVNSFPSDLIVIDEATLMSGVQIGNLRTALEVANAERTVPIKILFLGDLKQSGDPSGFQGKLDKLTVLDNTFTFNTDNRNTSFLVDSTKELNVKFRTGNQTINYNIDYFRNESYKKADVEFKSEYYQGNEGLAGFKVSNSEEFELSDLVSKINNKIIVKGDAIVITTSLKKKEEIIAKYPELLGIVYLTQEAIGMDNKKYEIDIPDPNHVYAYSSRLIESGKDGVYDIVTAEEAKTQVHAKENKITSNLFDTDSAGQPTGFSTSNLDYQLAYSLITSLGRAKEYACLVVPKSDAKHPISEASEGGNAKSRPFKKDIFSYKPLQPSSVKTNKSKQSALIKTEMDKYTGDKTEFVQEERTSTNIPEENLENVEIEIIPVNKGFVKGSNDTVRITEKDGVVIIEEYSTPESVPTALEYLGEETLEDLQDTLYVDMKDSGVFIPKDFESDPSSFETGEEVTARIDVFPSDGSPKIQIVRINSSWIKLPEGFSITSNQNDSKFVLKLNNNALVIDPLDASKLSNPC